MKRDPLRLRRGASLIELLVCLAIISVMISLMFPAIQKVRATAATSQCQNNLRQIGLGIQQYIPLAARSELFAGPWAR